MPARGMEEPQSVLMYNQHADEIEMREALQTGEETATGSAN